MRTIALIALALCLGFPTVTYAQINWHAPRAASKVWQDKLDENHREERNQTAERRAQAAAADAAWEAPLSSADIQGTLSRNRTEYERRLGMGKGFADRWLDRTARTERSQRSRGGGLATTSALPRTAQAGAGCSAASLPASERRRMINEYANRSVKDGRASADAWAQEQGRRFREKMAAEGEC